jgi:DNA-directed RNA polymerase specialized sigma24 family protein
MRIVTHQAHRRFRRRRLLQRLGFVSYDDACLANLVSEEASPELRSQCAQLDLALLRLAPEVRAAFILRFVEGYSLPEIAEYQACSLSTAKRRLSVGHAEVSRLVDFELPGAGSPLPHEESVGATRGATRV